MKSVVVREITSLILKPSIRSTASAPTPQVKHIRFSPVEPSRKSKQQSKIQDKKPLRNAHAQYYATITFNQIVLTPSQTDREVATRLIDIYFELFADVLGSEPDETGRADLKSEQILGKNGEVQQDRKGRIFVKNKKKKGNTGKEVNGAAGFVEVEDSNSKLISALLTGVNRALPFTKDVTSEAKWVPQRSPDGAKANMILGLTPIWTRSFSSPTNPHSTFPSKLLSWSSKYLSNCPRPLPLLQNRLWTDTSALSMILCTTLAWAHPPSRPCISTSCTNPSKTIRNIHLTAKRPSLNALYRSLSVVGVVPQNLLRVAYTYWARYVHAVIDSSCADYPPTFPSFSARFLVSDL